MNRDFKDALQELRRAVPPPERKEAFLQGIAPQRRRRPVWYAVPAVCAACLVLTAGVRVWQHRPAPLPATERPGTQATDPVQTGIVQTDPVQTGAEDRDVHRASLPAQSAETAGTAYTQPARQTDAPAQPVQTKPVQDAASPDAPVTPEPAPGIPETPEQTQTQAVTEVPDTADVPLPTQAPVPETQAATSAVQPRETALPATAEPPEPVETTGYAGHDYTIRMERYYDPAALLAACEGEPGEAFEPDPEAPWYENAIGAAELVVEGEVIAIDITRIGYRLWQQVDLRITAVYRGDLLPGDTISVYELGGSLPLDDYLSRNPDAAPILVPGMETQGAVYREESGCTTASAAGDACLYLLTQGRGRVPEGAYVYTEDADHSRLLAAQGGYVCAGDPELVIPQQALGVPAY